MKTQPLYLFLGLLVLLALGFFVLKQDPEPSLVAREAPNQAETEFQALVGSLPVSFDTSIFDDPSFSSLVDLATPITPEVSGRQDPFATLTSVTGR